MTAFIRLFAPLIRVHMLQRPFRVLLSIVGVSLGVFASVAIGAANVAVLQSFEQAVMSIAGSATLEVVAPDSGMDETIVETLRHVSGVVSVSPLLEETVTVQIGEHRGETIQVYGLDLVAETETRAFRVKADRERALDELLASDVIYLGRELAADWHIAPDSVLDVLAGGRLARLRVAGLIDGGDARSTLWDRVAVMDLAAAQVVFSSIGRVDRIELVTQPDGSVDDIAGAVRSVLPPHLVVQRPSQRTQQVENMVRSFQLNLRVLSWVGLLVGTFLIYNTMAFSVTQRRREIGIYRAIGMTQYEVSALFLIEGGLLGLFGGVLGGVAGIWLSHTLLTLVTRTITDLYVPVTSDGMMFSLDGRTIVAVMQGMAFGTVVAMIGALGPSVDASRTMTVRALAPGDYEQTQESRSRIFMAMSLGFLFIAVVSSFIRPVAGLPLFGYVATLCLLISLACLTPPCIQALGRRNWTSTPSSMVLRTSLRQIAADHAARHPGRNAVTVSALIVGLAIMIGVVVMVRSFRETVEAWVNETVMADLIVAPPAWLHGKQVGQSARSLPVSLMARLESVPGVAEVDAYRDVRVMAGGQNVALVARDLRLHAQRSRYVMLQGDSQTILIRAAETGGVLISEVLANRLKVRAGDRLTMTTPKGPLTVPIQGVFYDYATDGGKIVMDRTYYNRLWDDQFATVFAVYLAPRADSEEVHRAMIQLLANEGQNVVPPVVIRNKELRQEILDIFDRTFVLTYVLEIIAVLVAVLGIVNTLVTAVLERRRELATLQAIGASRNQVQWLVLWEAIYLGIIGAVLGVVGGLALAWLLIAVINKQSFGWTIRMTIPGWLLLQAVVLAVTAAWIAGYFPARWAARQSVAEGLREE